MEIDESETVKVLGFMKKYLKGCLKNIMATYLIRGRLFMAEFVSAVDAIRVRCRVSKKDKN